MKFLVFAMGPGESSHGYAIIKYLVEKGHQTIFALRQHANISFYTSRPFFDLVVTPTPSDLRDLVSTTQPDAIIICNSKAFNDTPFVEICPWKTIPTFSIDSNWLFESRGVNRCIQWLDKYFVTFPPSLFERGLKENGGHFPIPSSMRSRIEPIGFVPSYQKPDESVKGRIRQALSIHPHEKLIFCYVSGYGAGVRNFVLDMLVPVISRLRRKGRAIKVFVTGNLDLIRKQSSYDFDWLLLPRQAIIEDFYVHVASVDLVFMHHGLATIAQAISAQVPVIANIALRPIDPSLQSEVGEIMPLRQTGLCELLYSHFDLCKIQDTVEALLYDDQKIQQMQQMQKKYVSHGEQRLYASIMEYLSGVNNQPHFQADQFPILD
jgi:hypothetical protein